MSIERICLIAVSVFALLASIGWLSEHKRANLRERQYYSWRTAATEDGWGVHHKLPLPIPPDPNPRPPRREATVELPTADSDGERLAAFAAPEPSDANPYSIPPVRSVQLTDDNNYVQWFKHPIDLYINGVRVPTEKELLQVTQEESQ